MWWTLHTGRNTDITYYVNAMVALKDNVGQMIRETFWRYKDFQMKKTGYLQFSDEIYIQYHG